MLHDETLFSTWPTCWKMVPARLTLIRPLKYCIL